MLEMLGGVRRGGIKNMSGGLAWKWRDLEGEKMGGKRKSKKMRGRYELERGSYEEVERMNE